MMEFFSTVDKFIIYNKGLNQSLWCCKLDGSLIPQHGDSIKHAWNPHCHGIIHGVIGKVRMLPASEPKLLVITEQRSVGFLPGGHEVFKIEKIVCIALSVDSEQDIELKACSDHNDGKGQRIEGTQQKAFQQTWNSLKTTASNQLKGIKAASSRDIKDKEKLEKRLTEELLKMFNESGSFYYSITGDLSNTMQRLYDGSIDKHLPIWDQIDRRFFWNRHMLTDLMDEKEPLCKHWIIPIIQGHFEVERCSVDIVDGFSAVQQSTDDEDLSSDEEDGFTPVKDFVTGQNLKENEYDIVLVSRRSKYRAGTRYKRRGVDEDGNCANYVETEQIVCAMNHFVSFVQVRGSVPVFWSQPGYKYRPPPRLDRDEASTEKAFSAHFDGEISRYKQEVIVNLVEQTGREKIIGDAFLENILKYNSENLKFVNFDFHEYCGGMKFHNVAILMDGVADFLKEMRCCWVDEGGMAADQKSVFRVNCMDCLDRTNVVQATIARAVLENLLRKLGRMYPEQPLPVLSHRIHNHMWANNGDAISMQYAGTAAMKGDFTRTGERKFTGMMKDGYKSANRYYMNRFRDTYRQAVIDIMLGNAVSDDFAAIASIGKSTTDDDGWTSDKEECLAQLVLHCQKALIPTEEECLCGWALVDPFTFSENDDPQDEDVILLLTRNAYYIGRYDDRLEELVSYERIALSDLEKIEIGPEVHHFKGMYTFMRIYHRYSRVTGYFHTLRTVQNRTTEEAKGILTSISEMFVTACKPYSFNLRVVQCNLEKKKVKKSPKVIRLSSKRRLSNFNLIPLPDIETGNRTAKDQSSAKFYVEESDANTQFYDDATQASSLPEYETWIEMGPEGEVVQKRRLVPLPKSHSDSALNDNDSECKKESRIDSFLNRTRNIFNSEKLKKSVDLFSSRRSSEERKPSWTPDSDDTSSKGTRSSGSKQRTFLSSGFTAPLKGLQEKLKEKISERKGSQDSDLNANQRPISSKSSFLREIRSKLAISPMLRTKASHSLTVEEIERRKCCKTLIVEL